MSTPKNSEVTDMKKAVALFLYLFLVLSTGHVLACRVQLDKSMNAGDLVLTVNYIHKGFTPGEKGENSHAAKGEMMKVLVNLTIVNNGSAPHAISASDFLIEDKSGVQTGTISMDGVESLGRVTITPGTKISSNLLFEVKGGKQRYTLCYKPHEGVDRIIKIEL
jgi:hypothetical protein